MFSPFTAIPAHLAQEHSRDADAIRGDVTNLFAFADFFRAAVDGFVGVFIRRDAASPLEKTDQVAADLEIAVGCEIPIRRERRQQAVEGVLR